MKDYFAILDVFTINVNFHLQRSGLVTWNYLQTCFAASLKQLHFIWNASDFTIKGWIIFWGVIQNLGHGGISIFFITGCPQTRIGVSFDAQMFSASPWWRRKTMLLLDDDFRFLPAEQHGLPQGRFTVLDTRTHFPLPFRWLTKPLAIPFVMSFLHTVGSLEVKLWWIRINLGSISIDEMRAALCFFFLFSSLFFLFVQFHSARQGQAKSSSVTQIRR